ncbi:MAG: sigma-54-dependent Fis family transcriptional regulator [Desulfobacteraceae bacterium]|nr:sigma-54-dependent Fis family transcriptional regulator [Desulfobacteraceae bacterium]
MAVEKVFQKNRGNILVVDDDESLLKLIRLRLQSEGFRVTGVLGGREALEKQASESFDLAVIDYQLVGETGVEVMEGLQEYDPEMAVIILTAHGTIAKAVEAIKKGACSFLEKPYNDAVLIQQVNQCLEKNKLAREVKELRGMVSDRFAFDNIIGRDDKMVEVLKLVSQAALTDSTVVVQGESGTGKELIAKTLHVASDRRDGPFIAINCGAIPETLFESELFGYTQGAFTGASKSKKGLLDQARGGTFFFDEISEIPLSIQVKLLRVLQENEFYPLGSGEKKRLDARIIAASNRILADEVASGSFREDLYYRIHVIPISLPPLRERRESIPLLANHFLNEFRKRMDRNVQRFSPQAMEKLVYHPWPGNIRELKNVVEFCVATSENRVISDDLIMPDIHGRTMELKPLKEARLDFERDYLVQLLRLTKGNVSKSAKLAGRYRADFYDLMKRCGLTADQFRGDL